MIDKELLYDRLWESPEDWSLRLELIELALSEGDRAGAKRLVRASPAHVATPPEIQVRLHALLSGAATASPAATEVAPARQIVPVPPEREPEAISPGTRSDETLGGLAALVESSPEPSVRESQPSPGKSSRFKSSKPAPPLSRREIIDKWENYEGEFELAPLENTAPSERPSSQSDRLFSLSLALFAHIALIVGLSLVVIQMEQPEPPQLVVSVPHEREAELITTRITRPTPEIAPSAASAQAVDVISALNRSSDFNVPEVENPADQIVATAMEGIAPIGTGMSFTGQQVKSSDVNFFGLNGSGRKIVFIVDATREMLVDEKGGMSAYNKVKEEVGIMLANLNRGTEFNILLYQDQELVAFRDALVPGLPSNLRLAIEWLEPLNRDYEALGLRGDFGPSLDVAGGEDYPILPGDIAHYAKAIEKALEWQAGAIFCITSGYRGMARAPTPEMLKKMAGSDDGDAVDPRAQKAWQEAVAKTRAWLEKENAARREKGLDPKVVPNFNQLVREVTGATPPQRNNARGGMPGMPPVTPEEVEDQVERLVKDHFRAQSFEDPSLHIVLFLGEDEEIEPLHEEHFKNLTRKNRGKLKVLRGLAALQNVTGPGAE